MLVDLEDVPMIDSSGIGVLVRHLTAAKQKGGALKLLNPSKFALQTLKLVRVLNLFEVMDNQEAGGEVFSVERVVNLRREFPAEITVDLLRGRE